MNTKAEADVGELKAEIAQLREDLSKLADTIRAIASDEAEAGYERVRNAAREARTRATEASDAVGKEIADRPFTSVATAFGAGIVLGMLFARRS